MTTRHNHNHGRGKRAAGSNLFAAANAMFALANIGAHFLGNQERARMDALRAENLKLKNQNEYLRQGQNSNRVLEGDLKIELLKLKIESEKRKLGITDTPFQASNYTDPGDIRADERAHTLPNRYNLSE